MRLAAFLLRLGIIPALAGIFTYVLCGVTLSAFGLPVANYPLFAALGAGLVGYIFDSVTGLSSDIVDSVLRTKLSEIERRYDDDLITYTEAVTAYYKLGDGIPGYSSKLTGYERRIRLLIAKKFLPRVYVEDQKHGTSRSLREWVRVAETVRGLMGQRGFGTKLVHALSSKIFIDYLANQYLSGSYSSQTKPLRKRPAKKLAGRQLRGSSQTLYGGGFGTQTPNLRANLNSKTSQQEASEPKTQEISN